MTCGCTSFAAGGSATAWPAAAPRTARTLTAVNVSRRLQDVIHIPFIGTKAAVPRRSGSGERRPFLEGEAPGVDVARVRAVEVPHPQLPRAVRDLTGRVDRVGRDHVVGGVARGRALEPVRGAVRGDEVDLQVAAVA